MILVTFGTLGHRFFKYKPNLVLSHEDPGLYMGLGSYNIMQCWGKLKLWEWEGRSISGEEK